jgi:N-acetylneuraminic acid mutarotase
MRKFTCLLFLTVIIFSCSRDKEYDFPLLYIGQVTDIDDNGAVFHAKIVDESKEGIFDYGFVWSYNQVPDISTSRVIMADPVSTGVLSVKVNNDLIPDTVYNVRAFARNSKYITYSKTVSFRSLGSMPPVISDFSPEHGTHGSLVTIYGENFSGSAGNNIVSFGSVPARVESATNRELVVRLDMDLENLRSGIVPVTIRVAGQTVTSGKNFRLDGVNIIDFSPKSLKPGDTLRIELENFNPLQAGTIVRIGNFPAGEYSVSGNIVSCIIPYNAVFGENKIYVTSDNITCTSDELINVFSPWSVIKDGDKFYRTGAAAFSINGKGYVGMGENVNSSMWYVVYNDLNEFNPATGQWTKLADMPAMEREDVIGFSIGNKGYVGLGNHAGGYYFTDLWEYDPVTDSWEQKADFPGEVRYEAACVVIGDKAYVGLGYTSDDKRDLWQYDPALDQWTRVSDCPGSGGGYMGFCIDGKGYFTFGHSGSGGYSGIVWRYDPEKDEWARMSDFPGSLRSFPVSFEINGFGYIGTGQVSSRNLKDFWRYHADKDKWIRVSDLTADGRYFARSFIIGNKAYIVSGIDAEKMQYGRHDESLIIFEP